MIIAKARLRIKYDSFATITQSRLNLKASKVLFSISMNLLAWIILGILTGFIANLLDPHPTQGGLLGSVILGAVGALLGGFLASIIFGISIISLNISSILVALLVSMLLLFVSRSVEGPE